MIERVKNMLFISVQILIVDGFRFLNQILGSSVPLKNKTFILNY